MTQPATGTTAAKAGGGKKLSGKGGTAGAVLGVAKAVVPNAPPAGGRWGGQRLLVAEFIACMALIGLAPVVGQTSEPRPWITKAGATTALFFILALAGSGGPRAAKISAAFGGLVTFAVLIASKDLFAAIVALVTTGQGIEGFEGFDEGGEDGGDDAGSGVDIGEGAPGGVSD